MNVTISRNRVLVISTATVALLFLVLAARLSGSLLGKPVQFDLATDNYVGSHNFQVKIPGLDVINTEFQSVSGLESATEVSAGHNRTSTTTYSQLELKRIYKGVDAFYTWRLEVENGKIQPKDVEITLMDSAFRPIRKVDLTEAWPSGWRMPDMEASSSGPAIETIYLTARQIKEVAPGSQTGK